MKPDPRCARFSCGISWHLIFQARQANTKILQNHRMPEGKRREGKEKEGNESHTQIVWNMPEFKWKLKNVFSLFSFSLSAFWSFRFRITSEMSVLTRSGSRILPTQDNIEKQGYTFILRPRFEMGTPAFYRLIPRGYCDLSFNNFAVKYHVLL